MAVGSVGRRHGVWELIGLSVNRATAAHQHAETIGLSIESWDLHPTMCCPSPDIPVKSQSEPAADGLLHHAVDPHVRQPST